jgi:hypothetical protein
MGALEQVIQMKKQGISDNEIAAELTRQKVSPREINDALKQAQIKSAVSDLQDADMQPSPSLDDTSSNYSAPSPQPDYAPSPQKDYVPQEVGYSTQEYAPSEQQQAAGYETTYAGGGIDTDTIIEIAGQIFSENIRKIQSQVEDNAEANNLMQSKIENISERLKKIETTIEKLQIAILERVGSYGQNIEGIRKEMSMMQDSFSKMIAQKAEKQIPQRVEEQEKRINVQDNFSELPEETESMQKKIAKKKI